MALQFQCSKCRQLIRLADEHLGKVIGCPKCGTKLQVPDAQGPSSSKDPADSLIGKRIAHYKIESILGQGGMGKVYRARNINLAKTCALKILPPEFAKQDEKLIERFIREARSAASIEHSNVLPVHFVGREQGQYFIEMDYVDGGTLDDVLSEKGTLEPKEAARIVRDVAAALAEAHAKGIIHRDIKPSNVMLTKKGQVKVADFGLAKMSTAATGLTLTGMVVGTPLYMSPEQGQGKPADHRSDIYSLGVMFYQLLIGNPPYTADSPVALIYHHVHTPLPDPAKAGIPPALATVIRQMTAKAPEERYQNCAEVVRDLDAFLMPRAQAVVAAPAARRPKKKTKAGLYAAVVLAVMLLGAGGAFFALRRGGTVARKVEGDATTSSARSTAVPPPKPGQSPTPETPPSPYDDEYVATAGTGERIPHPLSRKTYKITHEGKTIEVPEGMVYVPAGKFLMGEGELPPTGPQHEVYLDAYFINKYEVTNAEYMEFVKATGHPVPLHWSYHGREILKERKNHPVVFVSWKDATAYAEWCGKRLPTEAEWEKAAAWDMTKKHHRNYPWGDDFDPERANHCYQCGCRCKGDEVTHRPWWNKWSASEEGKKIVGLGGNTAPVGKFTGDVSFLGCLDMAGNVREWVNDWYKASYYGVSPKKNPPGPAEEEADECRGLKGQDLGRCRAFRGGAWIIPPERLATSFRWRSAPAAVNISVGFRCAADCPWKPSRVVGSTGEAKAPVVAGGMKQSRAQTAKDAKIAEKEKEGKTSAPAAQVGARKVRGRGTAHRAPTVQSGCPSRTRHSAFARTGMSGLSN